MKSFKPRAVSLILILGFAFGALAQEPPMTPPSGGRPGGRGGRAIRDFLGLGAAPDAEAAKLGDPIYKQNCGTCHGETGRGSQGPNLVRSTSVLHDEKGETIGPIIKNGRPQGGMPPFPSLSQTDIYDISQYLHLQVEQAANRGLYGQLYGDLRKQASGDASKGRAFFQDNCASCHSATGDLVKIGAKFPEAVAMQARFIWPAPAGPRRVTVTPETGKPVSGTLLKYDDFNVSLRTASGEFEEWPTDRVKVVLEDKLGGHRALLPKYTDANLHDITAYLVTLK